MLLAWKRTANFADLHSSGANRGGRHGFDSSKTGEPMNTIAAAAPANIDIAAEERDVTFRRVVWRIVPFVTLIWFLAWVDRVNVGFAKLTMMSDLQWSDAVYGAGAGIFFIGYFIFEV